MAKELLKHRDNWLQDYIEQNLEHGEFSFLSKKALEDCKVSPNALRQATSRLKQKGKLLVLKPSLYVPIPPEYRTLGAPPIQWFIDQYMHMRQAEYYVGLLTAARFYGANHQAIQVFQVVATKQMKSFNIGKQSIEFVRKKNLEQFPSTQMKTDTGYFQVSSPEVTAFDLLRFHNQVGGYQHVITVLHELAEKLDSNELVKISKLEQDISLTQRLGHLLSVLGFEKLCQGLKKRISILDLQPIPLVPVRSLQKKNFKTDSVWNVVVNEKLESDLEFKA